MEKEKELENLELPELEKQFRREMTAILKVNSLADFPEALVPTKFEPKGLERWRDGE